MYIEFCLSRLQWLWLLKPISLKHSFDLGPDSDDAGGRLCPLMMFGKVDRDSSSASLVTKGSIGPFRSTFTLSSRECAAWLWAGFSLPVPVRLSEHWSERRLRRGDIRLRQSSIRLGFGKS